MASQGGKRSSESHLIGRTPQSPPAGNDATTRNADVADLSKDDYGTESQRMPAIEGSVVQRSHATRRDFSVNKERRPVLEPPVTKSTLSELDVNKIVNNPKLRHDINFDPELHFRPNLDGEKGRRKTQKAHDFWDTMRTQLQLYLTNREQFEREIGDIEWALPSVLRAIREILETLVPQRDRASVEETFNVELLMQQFRKGVADMVKLSNWLSQLLKCHCAPMRDDWVDEMVNQFSNGDRNGDVGMLASGMKNLLGVLEAMKLVSYLSKHSEAGNTNSS
jgi:hypothetical protein